jgi:hypothetical protein
MAVSFIGGGNWKIQRKPLTCCKSLPNFHKMLYLSAPGHEWDLNNFEKAVRKKYVIFIEFCMKWDPFSNLNLELMSARD